jgi:general secretion pathway protein K
MQSIHANKTELPKGILTIPVQFEGHSIDVTVRPLNGFFDINHAPVEVLADLYHFAGELDDSSAQKLAQATLEFRQTKNAKAMEIGFDAPEDLLNVPTMTYDLYAKIAGLIVAELKGGSGRVNPLAAPQGVIRVLTGGNAPRAEALMAQRDSNNGTMDTSFLNPAQIEIASSVNLQFQVQIDLSDSFIFQKTVHIHWATDARSGLPWRILGSQQRLLPSTASAN